MRRQLRAKIFAPTGLVKPNSIAGFQAAGARHLFELPPEILTDHLPDVEGDDGIPLHAKSK